MIGRSGHHFEHERFLAGYAVNLGDFGHLREHLRKLVVARLGRRVAADESDELEAEQFAIELRRVPANESAALQSLHAVVDRGRPEPDQGAELGKRRTPVALKRIEQSKIQFVEFARLDRYIRPFFHKTRKIFGTLTILRVIYSGNPRLPRRPGRAAKGAA